MPHVIIKLYSGRSEDQKQQLVDAIVNDLVQIGQCKESSVSVAIEEFDPHRWAHDVYTPDIIDKADNLYKKPGYNPF